MSQALLKAAMKAVTISVKSVLVPTDFSALSRKALVYADAVAKRYGSRLHVAHVLPLEVVWLPEQSLKKARHEAEEQMRAFVSTVELKTQPDELVSQGDIAEVTPDLLEQHGIDLVVLATHGRKGLQRFMLGSVAEEIFRTTACAVLTLGPKVPETPAAVLNRILFATDFTAESVAALPCAISLAQEHQAHLYLVHVVQKDHQIVAPHERALARPRYEQRLRELIPPGTTQVSTVERVVEFGSPTDGILLAGESCRADLIVLGIRGGGPLVRAATHLPGETAYNVIAQAHCPVLTVRGSQAP
jgi:nucleotide-binding universal stress UspA family protein